MTARGHWRGHPIEYQDEWLYSDTGKPVAQDKTRPCGSCGLPPTPEGHDGCLGTLPDVANACCGHGQHEDAYIVYDDGTARYGREAIVHLDRLKGEAP